MKIKLKSSVYIQGYGSYPLGSIADVNNAIANDLIKVGRAIKVEDEKVEKPKTVKKKVKKEGEE